MPRQVTETRRKYLIWAVSEVRRKLKQRAVEYLGGKCRRCSYDKCSAAMDFHHRDPTQKEFRIASGHTRKWEFIRAELDKCDLLCSNCHRELHAALDERERVKKEAEVRSQVPARQRGVPHGTKSGYSYHKCRCDLCRAASTSAKRSWAQKRTER